MLLTFHAIKRKPLTELISENEEDTLWVIREISLKLRILNESAG